MNQIVRIIVLACAITTMWAADLRTTIEAGDFQAKAGNYQNAANFYRLAIKMDAGNARTYEKLADVYLHLNMPKEASQLYEKSAELLSAQGETKPATPRQVATPGPQVAVLTGPPAGCSSEAAFKYTIGEGYEGAARKRGQVQVVFKTFELGSAVRYTDPYNRAVDTKAYPVKTEFTVRSDFKDATEEYDVDQRYICYLDTHNECGCTTQTGGSLGKIRRIPK
jgi:tetratricopeptide (TPR) repeat protein